MSEPTLLDRLKMILRTVASIVVWVVAIVVKIVRGILPGGTGKTSLAKPNNESRK